MRYFLLTQKADNISYLAKLSSQFIASWGVVGLSDLTVIFG